MNRRRFFKAATAGCAAAGLGPAATAAALRHSTTVQSANDVRSMTGRRSEAVRLGVASYSLRNFGRADAIAGIQATGARYVSIKSMHLPYELGPSEIRQGIAEFREAGLDVVGGGVIYLREDTDESMRPLFEYARTAGFPLMTIGPTRESLPRIERYVREFDIPVAIHNHGPEDPVFPAPSDAIEFIRDMDPRVGVCIDVGHTARTGNDVVEEVRNAGDRLLDLHIKDLRVLSDAGSQCVVGEGAMPIPGIFSALMDMGYAGYVNLEYEIDADNPVPGMQRSFAYMNGVLAGIEMG
jgi:sugar phosphate isomerase/epimerase